MNPNEISHLNGRERIRENVKNITKIFAEVSITAKPFFLKRGFQVTKNQIVTIRGVELSNFAMEKHIKN